MFSESFLMLIEKEPYSQISSLFRVWETEIVEGTPKKNDHTMTR